MKLLENWLLTEQQIEFQQLIQFLIENNSEVLLEEWWSDTFRAAKDYFEKNNNKPYVKRLYSKCIDRLKYDPKSRELTLRFRKNKRVYRYYGVDLRTLSKIMAADSRGKEFWRSIRNVYTNKGSKSKFGYNEILR